MDEIMKEMKREIDEMTKGKSRFEKLSYLLDIEEARISEGMISEPEEEAERFGKMMGDVENAEDLSVSERNALSGRIVYLNAEVNIRSRE